jgi:hypothetical protein
VESVTLNLKYIMNSKILKAAILAMLVAASPTTVLADYQIRFYTLNNDTAPTNPVFDSDGTTKLLGSAGWVGQLYVQIGAGAFSAVGNSVSFLNGGAAGFITGGALPDITVDNDAVTATTAGAYQLRVWNTANGSTFEAASAVAGAKFGSSPTVNVSILGYINSPGNPNNQTAPPGYPTANGFASFAVPEPATIALGLFGAAGLLIRRRK